MQSKIQFFHLIVRYWIEDWYLNKYTFFSTMGNGPFFRSLNSLAPAPTNLLCTTAVDFDDFLPDSPTENKAYW